MPGQLVTPNGTPDKRQNSISFRNFFFNEDMTSFIGILYKERVLMDEMRIEGLYQRCSASFNLVKAK